MSDDSPVIIVKGRDHGIAFQAAFHRSMPELRAEADTPEAAVDRLAGCLTVGLDCVYDDFHRDLIRRALGDVDQIRSGR